MTFTQRVVRNGAAAVGIALAMAMVLVAPAAARTNSDARIDGGQASAAPAQTMGPAWGIIRQTPVPANGRVSCFGYYGTFKVGTDVIVVDWDHTSDECFGIATDRTVWHTWPNSGGWTPMAGGAHADGIYSVGPEDSYGNKSVSVFVNSNSSVWAQDYDYIDGWKGSWYRRF
jgi:hypothetical protein